MAGGGQIATCQTLEQLRDALAAYCDQQQITRRALDRRAGLAEGQSAKLLCPTSVRRFGSTSLRWMLAALDLEIVLQVRSETDLSATDACVDASERKPSRQDWRRNRGPRWGKRMAARRALALTPEQRSASARKAAQARWQRQKESSE